MGMILSILVNAAALFVAAQLLSGITVADTGTLLLAALVFGVVNTFVKPLLTLLSLPITILTLGLFYLVVNAALLGLTAEEAGEIRQSNSELYLIELSPGRDPRLWKLIPSERLDEL